MKSLSDLQARISRLNLEKKELEEKLDRITSELRNVSTLQAKIPTLELEKNEVGEKLFQLLCEREELTIEFYTRRGKLLDLPGGGSSDNVAGADIEEFGGGADDR